MVKEIEKALRVGYELAEYVTSLLYHELPSEVIDQAKRVILDSIGTIYLGSKWERANGIKEFINNLEAKPECSVIGTELKTSLSWAAFANAAFSQVHDCNDGHRISAALGGSAHPGRVAIPTALAVGEKLGAGGKDLIESIVAGYDVATRIRGMKERPPASAYCSAAVAGKMLGLDLDEIRFAMGIAGFNSPRAVPQTRSLDINFLSNGYQAQIGIEAALLAKEGLNGPPIEDDNRLSTRFWNRGLGKEYEIMNVYFKPYPTCRMTHGAIEAVLSIKNEQDLDPNNIDEINVNQITHGMYIVEDDVDIDSYYKTCQFNLPYTVAIAILDGEVQEDQFTSERISDLELHKLAEKVKVIPDEELDSIYPERRRPTKVKIALKDGSEHSREVLYPKGEPRNPLTNEELYSKFLSWSKPLLKDKQAAKIRETVFNIENLDDINQLINLL